MVIVKRENLLALIIINYLYFCSLLKSEEFKQFNYSKYSFLK